MSEEKNEYSVPPVERALRLMRYIGEGNRAGNLSTVSKELGINRTTLLRLIHTLLKHRMIESIGEGAGYRLGSGMVSLGALAIQDRDIVQVCTPILKKLCHETEMSAHLGILDGREIIYLSREAPNSALVSNVRTGSRLLAHGSSIGRAILAEMAEAELQMIYSGEPVQTATDKTPATIEEIVNQAKIDKEAGFAWSQGNFESGIGSCAAVIYDYTRQPVGGINVSGPESRFSTDNQANAEKIQQAVLEAAKEASIELGYSKLV